MAGLEAPSGSGIASPKKNVGTSEKPQSSRHSTLALAGAVAAAAACLSGHVTLSSYPPMSYEGIPVRDHAVHEAAGSFIKLSRGTVHYKVHRPEHGHRSTEPPLVLIHGFSMGSQLWCDMPERINELTNRTVLTFDLYGRGYSDSAFPNDVHLFTGQLSELLFSLQKELGPGPYDLLGTSMGGAIAVNFVNTYPHLSHRLVLVAPAGLPVHIPISAKIIRLPLLGDLLMPLLGPLSLRSHSGNNYAQPHDPALTPMRDAMSGALERQIVANPGFFLSLLSTIRNFPLGTMRHVYEELGVKRRGHNTLLIWGDRDGVTPYTNAHETQRILGEGTRLVTLEGCGHVDMLAHPEYKDKQLLPLLADYLTVAA